MSKQAFLFILILVILGSTAVSNILLVSFTSHYEEVLLKSTGKATEGILSFCINNPPLFNNTCSNQTNQSALYECYVGAYDFDPNTTLIYDAIFITNDTLFVINDSTGLINFTPNQTFVGNHTVQLSINDQLGCSNSVQTSTLHIEVLNVNDPPYLVAPIPNQSFQNTTVLRNIFLDDYFADPDGDPLTYAYNFVGAGNIQISFSGDEIIIRSGTCGFTDHVYFTAIDPYNLTGNSNTVNIEVTCPENTDEGGTGSGEGGGGGSGTVRDCTPQWECSDWSACYPNGTQKRRCIDMNGCDADNYIQWHWRNCTYREIACQENWLCGDWGLCINGTQNRSCEDINDCGTYLSAPNITQACVVNQTCLNGRQDPGEEGVDCGGPCPPCQVTEAPSLIEDNYRMITTILLIILLFIAMLLLFYRLYHKQINRWFVRMGWWLTQRQPRVVLIGEKTKHYLIEQLFRLERHFPSYTPAETAVAFGALVRVYLAEALHLDRAFKHEQFTTAMEQAKLPAVLKGILASFYGQANHIEFGQYKPRRLEYVLLFDEFRELIFQTSHLSREEAAAQIKERHPEKGMSRTDLLFTRLSNAQIALMFNEIAAAKKEYMAIMAAYDALPVPEQGVMYRYLQRLYEEIRYLSNVV